MEIRETQKSLPEALKSLENDLKVQNIDFHESLQFSMKIDGVSTPEGQLGAQICFQEARKLRDKEHDGAKNKLREKKSRKK